MSKIKMSKSTSKSTSKYGTNPKIIEIDFGVTYTKDKIIQEIKDKPEANTLEMLRYYCGYGSNLDFDIEDKESLKEIADELKKCDIQKIKFGYREDDDFKIPENLIRSILQNVDSIKVFEVSLNHGDATEGESVITKSSELVKIFKILPYGKNIDTLSLLSFDDDHAVNALDYYLTHNPQIKCLDLQHRPITKKMSMTLNKGYINKSYGVKEIIGLKIKDTELRKLGDTTVVVCDTIKLFNEILTKSNNLVALQVIYDKAKDYSKPGAKKVPIPFVCKTKILEAIHNNSTLKKLDLFGFSLNEPLFTLLEEGSVDSLQKKCFIRSDKTSRWR